MTNKTTKAPSRSVRLFPAVGYIRMSTDQQAASPDRQRGEIVKLAEREGYRIIRWYEDLGLTGTESQNRPEFLRMLGDARKGTFRAILMFEQSRFSREDVFEVFEHWKALRGSNVEIVTCQRGRLDFKSLSGLITAIVEQHGARGESEKLGSRVVSGFKHRLALGQRASGTALMGFDRLMTDEAGHVVRRVHFSEKFSKPYNWTASLVPSADSAAVDAIRWAFDQAASGESLNAIAVGVNARGLRTTYRRKLTSCTIRRMLENPAYMGTLRAGKYSKGKFSRIDEEGVQLVQNAHVGLVTARLFHQVQDRLSVPRALRPKAGGRYLLSGLIVCDHCGHKMYGRMITARHGEEIQLGYFCTGGQYNIYEGPGCPRPVLHATPIEAFVLRLIRERILCKENRGKLADAARRWESLDAHSFESEQLAEVRRKIETATENLALAPAHQFEALSGLLDKWRAEENEWVRRLESERSRLAVHPTAACALETLAGAGERLQDADRIDLAAAIRATIREIRVHRRVLKKGTRSLLFLSGAVHFQPNVCSEGAVPFTDEDVFPDSKFWQLIRLLRASTRPLSGRAISRMMGYGCDMGAWHLLRDGLLAGLVKKQPSGRGWLIAEGEN